MHVGWSLLVGLIGFRVARRPIVRVLFVAPSDSDGDDGDGDRQPLLPRLDRRHPGRPLRRRDRSARAVDAARKLPAPAGAWYAVLESLTSLISASPWTYGVVLGFAAVDALFPLFPSETAAIAAGVLAGAGDLSIALRHRGAADGRVHRRQQLVRASGAPPGQTADPAALPRREGPRAPTLGRTHARPARRLPHRRRALHPGRPDRDDAHRRRHPHALDAVPPLRRPRRRPLGVLRRRSRLPRRQGVRGAAVARPPRSRLRVAARSRSASSWRAAFRARHCAAC